MTTAIILLNNCTFTGNLPMALALCIVPFILGWLAAWIFHKVGSLKSTIGELTTDNGELNAKVNTLTSDNTDLKVKITQLDAEIENLNGQIRKVKNDLIICESERNILKGNQQKPATVMFAGAKVKYDNLEIVARVSDPKLPNYSRLQALTPGLHWLKVPPIKSAKFSMEEVVPSRCTIRPPGLPRHDWQKMATLNGLKKLQDELNAGK
jgi:regulator of replication initiation timing